MTSNSLLRSLLFRLFAAIAASLVGMISALLVVLGFTTLKPETEYISSTSLQASLSLVTILVMVFVGTMTSNILASVLLSIFTPEKYHRKKDSTIQVFIFTFLLFLFFLPAYLFAGEAALGVSSIHFVTAALTTMLICEIMSGWQYCLTGLLGIIISGSFLMGLFSLLQRIEFNQSVVLIFSLPLIWICIILGIFVSESFQQALSRVYGPSALSAIHTE